jgi:protein KIBRA
LFQEKKQLLLEYRSIAPKSRSKQENQRIQQICKKLESDLNNAYEESNQCIATRLKVHEEKQMLLQQLLDALREVTHLEKQLKSVSASTLSISSGSSLGSLSTASSKGSLSGLSFTDIYGDPLSVDSHVDMVDVNRRVQRLLHPASEVSLSPRSSLSCSETPPASPLKLEAINEPMYENMQNLEISSTTAALQALHQQQQQQQQPQQQPLEYHQSSSAASILDFVRYELQELQEMKMKQQSLGLAPPLSPIYEKPSLLDIPQGMLLGGSVMC